MGVAFLVTALAYYPLLVGVMEKRAQVGLEEQAREIARAIGSGSQVSPGHDLPLNLLLLGRSVESDYMLIDYRDVITVSSRPGGQFDVGQPVDQLSEPLREAKVFDKNDVNIFNNGRYLSAEAPTGLGSTVLTLVSINTLKETYRETLFMIFGSLFAALTIALIIAFFLIRYLVRPLRALEKYTQALGNRQFDVRLEVKSGDELAKLAEAFNQMADRLKDYDEGRRRFFQNASHEMKTPLMSINGYAEGIRDGVFTGAALDNAIEIIHKESLRLRNVIDNMIDITILEEPHNTYFLPHDLCYIVQDAVETAGGYALEKGVQVGSEVEPNCWVVGDWDQLHSLFVNLLSNAIRHAHKRVSVQASLLEEQTRVLIKVLDDGPGFSPEDLEHAFDYFFSGAKEGSGLGLTIVQKIVAEHGGEIRLYNETQGGGAVAITLPVVKEKRRNDMKSTHLSH